MEREKERIAEKSRGKGSRERALRLLAAAARYGASLAKGVFRVWQESLGEKRKGRSFFFLVLSFTGAFLLALIASLAAFPLKVYPAGFAILSALGGRGRLRFFKGSDAEILQMETALALSVFSGVLVSCAFLPEGNLFYLLSYLILFLCRAGLTGGKFRDSLLARITASAAASVLTGLCLALLDGFTVNRVFAAVSFGILTPLLTYLLCGFYVFCASAAGMEAGGSRRKVYLEAGIFTGIFLVLYAVRDTSLLGYSPTVVISALLMLGASKYRGPLYGAALGLVGGMACPDASVAPALAVAGFFGGLFFEYSDPVALMVAFSAACGYGIYSGGLKEFGVISADLLCAVILFSVVSRFLPRREKEEAGIPGEALGRETVRSVKEKLNHMSEAFSSLSQVFYTVSDSMKKPKMTEVTRLVTDCCSEICSRCPRSSTCWGEEHSLHVDGTSRMASVLLTSSELEEKELPEPFRSSCGRSRELLRLVNRRYGELNGSFLKNHKTGILAGEYSSVSRLLRNSAGELDRELEYNPQMELRVKRVLKQLEIPYRRVAVFGTREIKIDVYGVRMERIAVSAEAVAEAFGKEFSCFFDTPSFLMFEESVVMRLRRCRCLQLECAKSGCAKKGEVVNGDSVAFFETDREYFYTLICDGMGSGREAAFTSRLAAIFIEKLMHCATPKNVTLEMLNSFLMAKTDETFTTVDLLEIDLLSGQAHFIKAGAAPSFILRGDRLHRIESRTPPAGVLGKMCAEQTAFSLRDGDYIIQLSDGAEENGEEHPVWLMEELVGGGFSSAAELCEILFLKAKERGEFRDDLSLAVVRVAFPRTKSPGND